MNILIVGAGAIGCLVGSKLILAGHQVTLVGRPRFVDAVRGRGLILHDEQGPHQITTSTAVNNLAEAFSGTDGGFDLAILCVKSFDTENAIADLVQAAGEHSVPVVLSLQNGVGNEETIAASLGSARVIAGTITTPVTVPGPGVVHVDKPSYSLGMSPWHPALPVAGFNATQRALDQAGFTVLSYPDPQGMKWTKLLMNMMGNASSAILDMPPGDIFADSMLVDIEIEAWREALSVMKASGISPVNIGSYPFGLLAPLVRTMPKITLRRVLRSKIGNARGGKMPSLHIDLHGGRSRSEISWLNGAVVASGQATKTKTPINQMLTEVLLSLVGSDEKQALWRHATARLIVTAGEYQAASRNL